MNEDIIYVIGNNEFGELAINDCDDIKDLTNVPYDSKQIDNIHCGYQYTIFSKLNCQQFWSAGYNEYGQCATNNADKSITKMTPIQYFKDKNISIINLCTNISGCCTFWISDKYRLYGNGLNELCQLGIGDAMNRKQPVLIDDLIFVNDVKSTSQFSIALCAKGIDIILTAWTALTSTKHFPNDIIELILSFYGNTTEIYMVPYKSNAWCKIPEFNEIRISKIDAGRYHSLFLETSGDLWAFGDNAQSQLGIMYVSSGVSKLPMRVANIMNVKDIACGWYHNLCITNDHQIYSWGYNSYGQCGNGTLINLRRPTLIATLKKYEIRSIVCGAYHSGAETMHNKCFLWGSNKFNECIGVDADKVSIPIQINDLIKGEGIQNKFIKGMYLGYHNTKLIVCSNVTASIN